MFSAGARVIVGTAEELAPSGLGSTHTKPNHSFDVQLVVSVLVLVLRSAFDEVVVVVVVVMGSLHPHQPGVLHVVELCVVVSEVEVVVEVGAEDDVVTEGTGTGEGLVMVVVWVVVCSSLQPNQPGVKQVVVVIVLV